jgi:hypothetical protein
MSFLSNGGKFKLYAVLNGLIFPTLTQSRISFERSKKINNKKMSVIIFSAKIMELFP